MPSIRTNNIATQYMREVGSISTTVNAKVNPIEPTIRALGQLSLSSQSAVIALFKQLADREGIRVTMTGTPGIQTPIDSIPLCLAKLLSDRHGQITIHMYEYLARRYLGQNPTPTTKKKLKEAMQLPSLFSF